MSSSKDSGSRDPSQPTRPEDRRRADGYTNRDDAGQERRFIVDVVASTLVAVAETLRTWTEKDLEAFLAGRRALTVRMPSRAAQPRGRGRDDDRIMRLADEVRTALSSLGTREEGHAYLERLGLSRAELQSLARTLDLPVTKSENMKRLQSRIVESLIGYRLRSDAIRGQGVRETARDPVPEAGD